MVAKLKPSQTRAQEEVFVQACSVAGLQARLPLPWPTPPETPACPKRRYRSYYVRPSRQGRTHRVDRLGRGI